MQLLPPDWAQIAVVYASGGGAGVAVQRWFLQAAWAAAVVCACCRGNPARTQLERFIRVCIVGWCGIAQVAGFLASPDYAYPAVPVAATVVYLAVILFAPLARITGRGLAFEALVGHVAMVGLAHSACLRMYASCGSLGLASCDLAQAVSWLSAFLLDVLLVTPFCCPASARGDNVIEAEEVVPGAALNAEATAGSCCRRGSPPGAIHTDSRGCCAGRRGVLSRLTLSHLDPLFALGVTRQLALEDLPPLPQALDTAVCARSFQDELDGARATAALDPARSGTGSGSLLRVLWRLFGRRWMVVGLLQLITVALSFVGPLVLNRLLAYLEAGEANAAGPSSTGIDAILPPDSAWSGLFWGCLLAIASVVSAFVSTQFNVFGIRIQTDLRAGIVDAVFRRFLAAPAGARLAYTGGLVNNFISVDVQKLQDAVTSVHQLWSLPLQVAVTLYLLYTQVELAFLAGLGVLAVFVPLNMVVSSKIGALTGEMMTARDERVRITGEVLAGIRIVKMQAWEVPLMDRIAVARAVEVRKLAGRKYLDAVCVFLWASMPVLVALATFATAVLTASPSSSSPLSASTVFTTVSLLSMLIFPLNAYSWIVTGVLEARISVRRLGGYLFGIADPAMVPDAAARADAGAAARVHSLLDSAACRVQLQGSFSFPTAADTHEAGSAPERSSPSPSTPFALRLNSPIVAAAGEVVCIVGSVGAGKTALLLAALGEMQPNDTSRGAGAPICGSVSYASQSPWIFRGTLRDNIVLQKDRHVRVAAADDGSGALFAGSTSEAAPARVHGVRPGGLAGYDALADSAGAASPVAHVDRYDVVAASVAAVHRSTEDDDESRYRRVIAACCLDVDVASMKDGHQTVISNDVLSGGQQARVSLARALFARSDVVLVDDVLAGLDARVASGVWHRALRSHHTTRPPAARRAWTWADFDAGQCSFCDVEGRTRVIVTNEGRHALGADKLLVLRCGEAAFFGPPSEATDAVMGAAGMGSPIATSATVPAAGHPGTASAVAAPTPAGSVTAASDAATFAESASVADSVTDEASTSSHAVEARAVGVIRRQVVVAYAAQVGTALAVTVLVSLTCMQLSKNGSDWWLSVWSSADTTASAAASTSSGSGPTPSLLARLAGWTDRQFLLVFGLFAAANALSTVVRSWSFAAAGLRACTQVHDKLLRAVVMAPVSFHDAVPLGRLLNRLSADQYSTDESLPFQFNILLAQAWGMAGTLLVLLYATSGAFVLVMPLLVWAYFRLQRTYRAASREIKRLEAVTRSPLLSHYSDSLAGATVLRAHSHDVRGTLTMREGLPLADACNTDVALLHDNQRAQFASSIAAQWLALRLQLLGAAVLAAVALFSVFARIYTSPDAAAASDDGGCADTTALLDPLRATTSSTGVAGVAGLAVTYSIPIVGALQGLVNAFAETEKEFVAVERAVEYADVEPEEAAQLTAPLLPPAAAAPPNKKRTNASPAAIAGRSRTPPPSMTLSPRFVPKRGPSTELSMPLLHAEGGSEVETVSINVMGPARSMQPSFDSSMSFVDALAASRPTPWQPGRGAIQFRALTVRYPGTSRPAVDALSLRVRPGEVIHVAGRTGSGKSTIIGALLRLVPWTAGSVEVDGTNIGSVPLQELRSNIAVIPQQPLLFSGTVRYNLDPLGVHADTDVVAALAACGLAVGASSAGAGVAVAPAGRTGAGSSGGGGRHVRLDDAVEEGGRNFSVGERQLLALARALLRKAPIVCVDEAAANTDSRTDEVINDVLARSFAGATQLIIAHRMSTLLHRATRVVVLREGRVVQDGPPSALTAQPGGEFAAMVAAARGAA